MKVSDIYPKFVILDDWGRRLEIRARQSLYTRKQLDTLIPGEQPDAEEPLSRIQFAMLLLQKIEEIAGNAANADQPDSPSPLDDISSDLRAWLGPRPKRMR